MLTVITTTYNCALYISQAVRSILNQTFKDFEYLIIDDGSNDNTEMIISKINDKRIRYVKLEHIGRAAALNHALTLAKYETIALMDADDISHPYRLQKQLVLLKSKNQFIFCDTAYFKNKKIKYYIKSSNNSEELMKKLLLHGHFNNSSSLFNKDHVIVNGGYDESLSAYEDYDLWLKLKNKSEFMVLPEIYHFVRLRSDSMTTSDPNKLKHILYSIQENYFNDLSSNFNIVKESDQNILKGWREFFYGDERLARKYWQKIHPYKRGIKVNFVLALSYFPILFLEYIKKNRLRLRYQYLIYMIKSFNTIQKQFDQINLDCQLEVKQIE